ncbi:hypothetical protein LWP59_10800 [Amycolatopsis acidiphila]|nr:hypothetical protein [Amycolatopsis acidiphila]UIJ62069.1 hypothetical protein LWP59_10800 [Amycolatopsis acidiphila]
MREMGYRGLSLLVRRIAGEEVPSEHLPPALMVRGSSTGSPPAGSLSVGQP